jgi:hypothetical protein
MTWPPITPERMVGEARSAKVIYRSEAIHPRHHANFRVFHPLDFLAEVSAHIPDAHEKTTLFYGWYSNRMRGYRKQHGWLAKGEAADPLPGPVDQAPLGVRCSWAHLIRPVCCSLPFIPHSEFRTPHSYDPLLCPRCGGTMRVIAVIERQTVVRQIRSAELATKPRAPGPPHPSAEPPCAPRPDQRPGG